MVNNTISYLNETFHFQTTGIGEPVVLIHGFGEDARIWSKISAELKTKFSIITFDLPGCGVNQHCASSFCTIAHTANIIIAMLEKLECKKVSLVGHSMGGYIALQILKINPEYVSKISLVHSSIFADDAEKKSARQKNIDFINQHGAKLFLKQTLPNLFANQYVTNNKEWLDSYITGLEYLKEDVLTNYTVSMKNRDDSSNLVKEMHIPIQFIAGMEDKAVPFLTSLKQSHIAKISYFHKLKNVGHMGMFEAKEKLVENLLGFL